MKNNKWNIIVYVHAILLLWALLFFVSLFIPDCGKSASLLAIGNTLFLFINIPLAVFSFVLKAKGHFGRQYEGFIVVLSILNIIVGIAVLLFVMFLLQMP